MWSTAWMAEWTISGSINLPDGVKETWDQLRPQTNLRSLRFFSRANALMSWLSIYHPVFTSERPPAPPQYALKWPRWTKNVFVRFTVAYRNSNLEIIEEILSTGKSSFYLMFFLLLIVSFKIILMFSYNTCMQYYVYPLLELVMRSSLEWLWIFGISL